MKVRSRRKQLPRDNPYANLHKKLVDFIHEVSLDQEKLARNEYVRLENLILRGIYATEKGEIYLRWSDKERLANMSVKMLNTRSKASMLSPMQIMHCSHQAQAQKYASVSPRKPRSERQPRLTAKYYQEILWSITAEHPQWRKEQIFAEMRQYFETIPAFRVYRMLYDMGHFSVPKETKRMTWKELLEKYKEVTWAGDFFSIEVWTEFGQVTYYVLFFIHLASHRVVVGGISPHATESWLINLIKQWTDSFSPLGENARFLIRDRDRRYTKQVDIYFAGIGITPIKITPASPVMNCFAEQFVKKIKHECLNHCLFLSGKDLSDTIEKYLYYYHRQRPHHRLNGACIDEDERHWQTDGEIMQTSTIPGITNFYYRKNNVNEAIS